jgi:hypothetical protein
LGVGSGFRFGFRVEGWSGFGCPGDAGCAEQASYVRYFEFVGCVECAGDAERADERWGVGPEACFGCARERAAACGGCASERRYGYGRLGGFRCCGSFANRA